MDHALDLLAGKLELAMSASSVHNSSGSWISAFRGTNAKKHVLMGVYRSSAIPRLRGVELTPAFELRADTGLTHEGDPLKPKARFPCCNWFPFALRTFCCRQPLNFRRKSRKVSGLSAFIIRHISRLGLRRVFWNRDWLAPIKRWIRLSRGYMPLRICQLGARKPFPRFSPAQYAPHEFELPILTVRPLGLLPASMVLTVGTLYPSSIKALFLFMSYKLCHISC